MSDSEPTFELDDELLSAYLDGELAPEERAAVEARLATDPAAQQLLNELRTVSQAVQSMPPIALGRDLSGAIVRRAQAAKPVATTSEPTDASHLGDTMPKISAFRTTRGWIWASLALAAGLLIMFVQKGDESAKKLTPIAQRSAGRDAGQIADESAIVVQRQLAETDKPQSPPPAMVASDSVSKEEKLLLPAAVPQAMPAGPEGQLRDSAAYEKAPARTPLAASATRSKSDTVELRSGDRSSTAVAATGAGSVDKLGTQPQSAVRPGALGGAMPAAAGAPKDAELAGADRRLVVQVVAKQNALQNKSFDKLLNDQQITVEPQLKDRALELGDLAKQLKEKRAAERLADATDADREADIVLVEAPAPAILSCLDGLRKDTDNYVRIEVDEAPASRERPEGRPAPAKKSAGDLRRYNRGDNSQRRYDMKLTQNKMYFDYLYEPTGESGPQEPGRAGGYAIANSGGLKPSSEVQSQDRKSELTTNLGRARRVQLTDNAGGRASVQFDSKNAPSSPGGAKVAKAPAPQQTPQARMKSGAENWKVLFVIRPEDAAASSPQPADRAK